MCWFSAEDEEKWKMKLKMTRGAFDEIHGASSHVDVTSTWGQLKSPSKLMVKALSPSKQTISPVSTYQRPIKSIIEAQKTTISCSSKNMNAWMSVGCSRAELATTYMRFPKKKKKKVDFRLPFQSCFPRLKERVSIHVQYTLRLSNFFTVWLMYTSEVSNGCGDHPQYHLFYFLPSHISPDIIQHAFVKT
ncbi:hypothetical protein BDN70DRAFT_508074 [Pholiota conissans]|uniref:Uncharacterized protein n=1 Tax=Pholiota conissans TaxID=109636 RepID=A0A9P5Z5I8_9AGAR|nr:hypothetical protein BDN70DRAFT_508074 [Pholiota conissans]